MYVANHYVKVNGKLYKKGEKIPDGLTKEKAVWLMNAGAISESAPAVYEQEKEEEPEQNSEDEDQNLEDEIEEDSETEDPDEIDETAEAPEIDVMAGIVQDKPEEAKKSERKDKNPAKKQAVKGGKNV